MLQSQQRKQKPVEQLSALLKQQADRLAARGRQIVDTLDDIRSLGKQKYDLEQQHAQALLKLANQLLSKKDNFPSYSLRTDSETNRRTISSAWRTVLEESQTMSWQRLKAVESYNSGVFEPCQRLKDRVTATVKKGLDQLKLLQDNLMQSTKEMADFSKQHADAEAVSVDALNKLNEETSRLQKNPRLSTVALGKLRERRDANAAKATTTRNSYLIERAAVNAHLLYYHETQLPEIYKMIDSTVFSEVSCILNALAKPDESVCTAMSVMQKKVLECASSLDHEFDLQCFLDGNAELDEPLQFDSEATCDGQSVATLTPDEHQLKSEVRKWAGKIVTEEKTLRQLQEKLQQQPQPSDAIDGSPVYSIIDVSKKSNASLDKDAQIVRDKLSADFQKSKTAITKARARLDALKATGIDVDSLIAEALPAKRDIDHDTDSMHSSSSDSTNRDNTSGGSQSISSNVTRGRGLPTPDQTLLPEQTYQVQALFSHEPRVADELRLCEGAIYTVLGPADDDGWVKARDAEGNMGVLPMNYAVLLSANDASVYQNEADSYEVPPDDPLEEDVYVAPAPAAAGEPRSAVPAAAESRNTVVDGKMSLTNFASQVPALLTPSASDHYGVAPADYTTRSEASVSPVRLRPPKPAPRPPSVAPPPPRLPAPSYRASDSVNSPVLLRALFSYVATNSEELSFNEGDQILLIRKDEESDDGFWEGQHQDGRKGVFPSILVEIEKN